jgi:hypothetical protein
MESDTGISSLAKLPGDTKQWEDTAKAFGQGKWEDVAGGLAALFVSVLGGPALAAAAAGGFAKRGYAWLLANTATTRLRRAEAEYDELKKPELFARTVGEILKQAQEQEGAYQRAFLASCFEEVITELRASEQRLDATQSDYFLQTTRFIGRRLDESDQLLRSILQGQEQLLLFSQFRAANADLASEIRVDEFARIIEERTRQFVGRDFVFTKIRDAVSAGGSGYILIHGEPGIGKTAIMAKLVREHGYVHHFNDMSGGIVEADQFLSNVCAQLIVRYGLPHASLPARASKDNGYLVKLLEEVTSCQERRPVVVLVDALDEARVTEASSNRLLLPQSLPEGAFFVVTTRPSVGFQLLVDQRLDLKIEDRSKENLDDTRKYVHRVLDDFPDRLRPQMQRWKLDDEGFIEAITNAADGNFMYLVQILRDIQGSVLDSESASDIRHLPSKLIDYYERHFTQMHEALNQALAADLDKVLGIVAVARAPLTASYVADVAGIEPRRAAEFLTSWRMFLNDEARVGNEAAWRVYHSSFREFLEQKLDLGAAEDALADRALQRLDVSGQ